MKTRAHFQPVIFSARNRKRRRKITERGYFWLRYVVFLILLTLTTLFVWLT
jgi:hypothetical protein